MNNSGNNQTENMGSNQGTQNDKLFTQDDVNKILQARLSKEKDKAGKAAGAEYEDRLKELEAREHKLTVLETLHKKGLNPELADIIQCSDEKDLEDKLNTLDRIYSEKYRQDPKQEKEKTPGFHRVGAGRPGNRSRGDAVRDAMGMNY